MAARVIADLFSGRPNPSWTLSTTDVVELNRRLGDLQVCDAAPAQDSQLGYRGLLLELDTEEEVRVWRGHVRRGAVMLLDPAQALERWIVERAGEELDSAVRQAIEHAIADGSR